MTAPSSIEARLSEHSDVFLKFHYGELKDLGKHFLVIASTVLAFSVTFSEKIIGLTDTAVTQRVLLLASWVLLVASVIAAGTGLYFNFRAGAQAVGAVIKMKPGEFKPLVRITYRLYETAGGTLIASLVLLVLCGAIKVL